LSRFSDAAFEWLTKKSPHSAVTSAVLWSGLCGDYPNLTTPSENRKTPRNTAMRDIRLDRKHRFVVSGKRVSLAAQDTTT